MKAINGTDKPTPDKECAVKVPVTTPAMNDKSYRGFEGEQRPATNRGAITKPAPCTHSQLKLQAMSTEELSKLVFSSLETAVAEDVKVDTAASSKEGSDGEEPKSGGVFCLKSKVITRQVSRQGRESQRWATDSKTNQLARLTTGCVPILKTGQVLLVSSSRKPEWILPKGGWEQDESMEESAIRESFEESGVIGTLGPKLTEVYYETRKGRKRRLEMEELAKKKRIEAHAAGPLPVSEDETNTVDTASTPLTKNEMNPPSDVSSSSNQLETPQQDKSVAVRVSFPDKSSTPMLSAAVVARIGGSEKSLADETSSVVSDASNTYAHVRMTLFPLYVTEVKGSWPESGRLRKAMDIDDAIAMLESRPEFRTCLMEVKDKGLHLARHT